MIAASGLVSVVNVTVTETIERVYSVPVEALTHAEDGSLLPISEEHVRGLIRGRVPCGESVVAQGYRISDAVSFKLATDDAPPRTSLEEAKAILEDQGDPHVSFQLIVPLSGLLEAAASGTDDYIVEDFLHERALSFGSPYAASWKLLRVVDDEHVMVEYTTDLNEAIAECESDER